MTSENRIANRADAYWAGRLARLDMEPPTVPPQWTEHAAAWIEGWHDYDLRFPDASQTSV